MKRLLPYAFLLPLVLMPKGCDRLKPGARRIRPRTSSLCPQGWADASQSQGNTAEAKFTWTWTTPAGLTIFSGVGAAGWCALPPPSTTHFHLDVEYPGGWISSVDGNVAFVTATPSPAIPPTRTPTISPTPAPIPTSIPCSDVGAPYGRPYPMFGWCINCKGDVVGQQIVTGVCSALATPITPTPGRVNPLGVPTRRPPIVVPFRPTP
jgi:hypothetical protein